jgi:hypothetical protein
MAADNNVVVERLELLDQLADKQEEMRSKQIAVTPVEQAMFTSILELPPDRQVTALRRFIQRMERKLSEISVQTVPAAQKKKLQHHAMLRGRAWQWLHHRLLLTVQQSLWTLPTSGDVCCIGLSILRMSARQAHIMDPAHSTQQIHPPSEQFNIHEIHSPSEEWEREYVRK